MSAPQPQQRPLRMNAVPQGEVGVGALSEPVIQSPAQSHDQSFEMSEPIALLAAASNDARTASPSAIVPARHSTPRRRLARRLISLSPTLPALLSLAGCAEHHGHSAGARHDVLLDPSATIIATQPPQPEKTQAESMVSDYLKSVNAAMGRKEDGSGPVAATRPWITGGRVRHAGAPEETILAAAGDLLQRAEKLFHDAQAAAARYGPRQPAATPATMDALYHMIEERIAARPQQINYALALKLLQSAEPADPTTNPQGAALPASVALGDELLVRELSKAITAISATPAAADTPIGTRAAPLINIVESWKTQDDKLTLPRFALATAVDSFGSFTPAPDSFTSGAAQRLVMYCEVANFVSKADGGKFHTQLTQQETLFTDDGLVIYRASPATVDDVCLNQRRDFYVAKRITLPENLAAGKYVLRITVTDTLANRVAQADVPITMTAAAVAAR
jgi:hypothetical protein